MKKYFTHSEVKIRTEIRPGDLGSVVGLHGMIYYREYQYGPSFESYVAGGLHEFYSQYDQEKDRVWICEHGDKIIGFLLIMHRTSFTCPITFLYFTAGIQRIGFGKITDGPVYAISEGGELPGSLSMDNKRTDSGRVFISTVWIPVD